MNLDEIKPKDLTEEQKRFITFKNIFDSKEETESYDKAERKDRIDKALDRLSDNPEDKKLISTIFIAELTRYLNEDIFKIRENDYGITEKYYPHLLNQIKKLAFELKLTNSLEISNLFTFLLWNGYLSKTKQNVYSIENRKLIEGLFFADIVDGVGVCLNHADMLKDILNVCGYSSSLLMNLADKKTTSNYKLNIERKINKSKRGTEIMTFALNPIIKKIGNHAFTLIEDTGKIYIYDSTNLLLLSIKDPYTAEVINGKGIYKLHPYLSYLLNNNQGKNDAISKLFMTNNFNPPYDRRNLIFTSEDNMALFSDRQNLIEDFYDDVRIDLLKISEATDKIKKRKRTK